MVLYDAHKPMEYSAPLAEFIGNWSATTVNLPEKLAVGETRMAAIDISLRCAKIFMALMQADFSADENNKALVFWQKPASVLTGATPMAEGKLILTPAMPLVNIGVKAMPNSVHLAASMAQPSLVLWLANQEVMMT